MRWVISRLLVTFLAVGAFAAAVVSSAGPAGADITWGTPSEVAGLFNAGGDTVIMSVSCSSDGNCAAGGYYKDSSGKTQAFVVDEVAGTWGTPSEVAGSLNTGGNAWVNSVSCSSDGNCAPSGRYRDSPGTIRTSSSTRSPAPGERRARSPVRSTPAVTRGSIRSRDLGRQPRRRGAIQRQLRELWRLRRRRGGRCLGNGERGRRIAQHRR